jgi:hypothetical protein
MYDIQDKNYEASMGSDNRSILIRLPAVSWAFLHGVSQHHNTTQLGIQRVVTRNEIRLKRSPRYRHVRLCFPVEISNEYSRLGVGHGNDLNDYDVEFLQFTHPDLPEPAWTEVRLKWRVHIIRSEIRTVKRPLLVSKAVTQIREAMDKMRAANPNVPANEK